MYYKLNSPYIIPQPEDVDLMAESFELLKTKFQPAIIDEFDFDLNEFDPISKFSHLGSNAIIDLGSISKNKFIMFCLGEPHFSSYKGHQNKDLEYLTWGVLKLRKDIGKLIIKRESLADKVTDFFKKSEIDFEDDPGFSKKFYVMADNKKAAVNWLSYSVRNAISEINIPDFLIIGIGNKLVIGNCNLIDPETTLAFAKFLNKIH